MSFLYLQTFYSSISLDHKTKLQQYLYQNVEEKVKKTCEALF